MQSSGKKDFMRIREKEMKKDPMKNENYFIKYSSVILALIGLLVPAIYYLGVMFYEGRLSAYGLDAKFFPLDTVDVYISSYNAVSYYIFDYLNNIKKITYAIFIPMAVMIVFIGIIQYMSTKDFFAKFNIFKVKNNIQSGFVDKLFLFMIGVATLLALTMIIGIAWIMLPQNFYTKGELSESPKIRAYHVFGCNYTEDDFSICTQVLDENKMKTYEGMLITKHNNNVAFYDKSGSYIFTLKSSQSLYRKKILDNNMTK